MESAQGGGVMTFEERLEQMEIEIRKPAFRNGSGRASEINYWVFDYPPQHELEVRQRVEEMKAKNSKGNDNFNLVVYDLYDMVIDILEEEDFVDMTCDFEERKGFGKIISAVGNLLCVNDDNSEIVERIRDNTPDNSIVLLTGIGKCYPILRSHKILNNLSQSFRRVPVVLFFPGTYDEQSLILFNELKDDNYYRAYRLVKP